MALADPAILIPAIAENIEGIQFVWERRRDLDNWSYHVDSARSAFEEQPTGPHHAAEQAFRLAYSLVKYVAVPWGICLSPSDVFALCAMIADPKVSA